MEFARATALENQEVYLISSLRQQLERGLTPKLLCIVFVPLRYSFIPAIVLVPVSPGLPAAGWAGTDSGIPCHFFPKIIFHLL